MHKQENHAGDFSAVLFLIASASGAAMTIKPSACRALRFLFALAVTTTAENRCLESVHHSVLAVMTIARNVRHLSADHRCWPRFGACRSGHPVDAMFVRPKVVIRQR
jgi:hypothetical protein